MAEANRKPAQRSDVEIIKENSRYLRGTLLESLADPLTGAIADADTQLSKFHGMYQQDDRDLRSERMKQKLEPLYSFMIRLRLPGGICTPAQWLQLDDIARTYANGTLRLTTRQTFQYHGVLKRHLKAVHQAFNRVLLDSIAACGDVNRNVMCHPNPYHSTLHEQVAPWAARISEHLLPRTRAYQEIWLDADKVEPGTDEEPLYKDVYLPRKFKIAIAVPPSNDVDIYANDLGFIAIAEGDELVGFNVTVGGGLGMTHSEPATYPRLADVIGFCTPDQVLEVAETILAIQRDHGDRTNRKHARFKYTIDDHGLPWLQEELNRRLGWDLAPARPFEFASNGDEYGWHQGSDGRWHLTLFILSGRIKDTPDQQLMTGLRKIAEVHTGDFRLTGNQNLIIANVEEADKPAIEALVAEYGLDDGSGRSALRRNAMSCVAFPTCGLAMAESERYLPDLLDKLEAVVDEAGLRDDPILIRMTGCPNGCGRPYLGEIGLVGKSPGRYNLYLGASFNGDRLNKLYRESVDEAGILETLTPLIHEYARERQDGERFGDYVIRAGHVAAVRAGREFHD